MSVGKNWKIYRNTGTHDVPVWSELKRARDVSVPLSKGQAEVTRREYDWELFRGALKSGGIEFDYVYHSSTETEFAALLDSFANDTPIQLAVVDQDIATTGAWGFKSWCEVGDLPLDAPIKEGTVLKLKAFPTDRDDATPAVTHGPEFITTA